MQNYCNTVPRSVSLHSVCFSVYNHHAFLITWFKSIGNLYALRKAAFNLINRAGEGVVLKLSFQHLLSLYLLSVCSICF